MVRRLLKEGMDYVFGTTEHESVNTGEVTFDSSTASASVGPDVLNYSSGQYHGHDLGIVFEVDREVTITQLQVDANFTGDLDIEVCYFEEGVGVGNLIDSDTVTGIAPGVQWIDVNLQLDVTNELVVLRRLDASNTPLFRTSSGDVSYPIENEPVTIHGGADLDTGSINDYHYYWFDWTVEYEGTPQTVSQDGNDVSVPKASVDELNKVFHPAPDESIQAAIDKAAERGGKVVLHPGEIYDEGQELVVKKGVTLDFNGSKLRPMADYDVMFVESNTKVIHPTIDVQHLSYTSTAMALDTERNGRSYAFSTGQPCEIIGADLRADHGDMTGTGLLLRAHAGTISGLRNISAAVKGFGTGIELYADRAGTGFGYINSCVLDFVTWFCDVGIKETGASDSPMESIIYVEIQPTSSGAGSTGLIHNETNRTRTPLYYGIPWDAHSASGEALRGHIKMVTHVNIDNTGVIENSPNADGLVRTYRQSEEWYTDLDSGRTWKTDHPGNRQEWTFFDAGNSGSDTTYVSIRDSGRSGEMRFHLPQVTHLTGLHTYNHVTGSAALDFGELALDVNYQGNGNGALLKRDGTTGDVYVFEATDMI